jgi:DNA repair exonuclease SbcCD ATPase subunit
MTAAEDIAELRRKTDDQQRQIVELRLMISQRDEAHAALIQHLVTKQIAGELDDRLPTKLERAYLAEIFARAVQRAKDKNDLLVHFLKWGVGGALAFFLYAGWESVKAKLGVRGGSQ